VPYTKTIVCLANSRKTSGRCVAGRKWTGQAFGDWIRPVSARATEEVSLEERRYPNGRDPQLLDVIEIPLLLPRPHTYQQENHLIDADSHWINRGRLDWDEILPALEKIRGPLWLNGPSTYNGLHDQVPASDAESFSRSLYLVRPTDCRIVVSVDGAAFGNPKRRVRAAFRVGHHSYRLIVTDPVAESFFLRRKDGDYPLDDAIFTISLGEVYGGFAYKLVAAVLTPGGLKGRL
jgi:hypothetical protein